MITGAGFKDASIVDKSNFNASSLLEGMDIEGTMKEGCPDAEKVEEFASGVISIKVLRLNDGK